MAILSMQSRIDDLARQAGFDAAGIAAVPAPGSPEDQAERNRFEGWVDAGRAVELSEDAVKQRLSRGRKLLQAQFLAFVAGALKQTTPGKTFTLGVIAALPLLATTAKAATAGATAAKGGAMAKATGLGALLQTILKIVLPIGWVVSWRPGSALRWAATPPANRSPDANR